MRRSAATLQEYNEFLDRFDSTDVNGTMRDLKLSSIACDLRRSKLGLSPAPMSVEQIEIIRMLYPSMGDAVVFLFPDWTMQELRRCAYETDCDNPV